MWPATLARTCRRTGRRALRRSSRTRALEDWLATLRHGSPRRASRCWATRNGRRRRIHRPRPRLRNDEAAWRSGDRLTSWGSGTQPASGWGYRSGNASGGLNWYRFRRSFHRDCLNFRKGCLGFFRDRCLLFSGCFGRFRRFFHRCRCLGLRNGRRLGGRSNYGGRRTHR